MHFDRFFDEYWQVTAGSRGVVFLTRDDEGATAEIGKLAEQFDLPNQLGGLSEGGLPVQYFGTKAVIAGTSIIIASRNLRRLSRMNGKEFLASLSFLRLPLIVIDRAGFATDTVP